MSDQCRQCQMRGDLDGCTGTNCGHHENWINLTRIKRIKELEDKVLRVVRGEFGQICSYCGAEFKAGGWDDLQAHIKVCPEHPLTKANARIADLEADKERLDFLGDRLIGLEQCFSDSSEWYEFRYTLGGYEEGKTIREAIDKARKS